MGQANISRSQHGRGGGAGTWKTKPIRLLKDLDSGLPSTKTLPVTLLCGTRCARTFRRLVFPLPEGPICIRQTSSKPGTEIQGESQDKEQC